MNLEDNTQQGISEAVAAYHVLKTICDEYDIDLDLFISVQREIDR